MITTKLQNALCANCTSALYSDLPVYYRSNGSLVEVRDFNERLEWAQSGVPLIGADKRLFRPLAVTFVAGTALCGACAHEALRPADPLGLFRRR